MYGCCNLCALMNNINVLYVLFLPHVSMTRTTI